ncbi:MAG TPA: hypothetical protein VJN48_09020 [Terriglobales bacterium]|nr:hypothetical protein [Terriglobales bacterium]
MQHLVQVAAGGAQCGENAHQNSGNYGHGKGIDKYPPVKAKIQLYRKIGVQIDGAQSCATPDSQHHAGGPAQNRQQEAFGEQQADQVPAPRAQSCPNGEFPLPHRGPHQQNVAHVHAGQQQHQYRQPQK